MMIRINLLPQDQRPPRWNYTRLLLIPFLAVAIAIGSVYGYGEYRYYRLTEELEQSRARYDAMTLQQQQMQLAQARQTAIQARQKYLLQLSASRSSWHAVMSHLGGLMPRNVWLTEIGSAQAGVLQMKGSSTGYADMILFLGKLEVDRSFIEPALLRVEQNEKSSLTKFEISTKLRGM